MMADPHPQTFGAGKECFTADGNNGVNPVAFHHNFDIFGSTVRSIKGVGARGADNSAAADANRVPSAAEDP